MSIPPPPPPPPGPKPTWTPYGTPFQDDVEDFRPDPSRLRRGLALAAVTAVTLGLLGVAVVVGGGDRDTDQGLVDLSAVRTYDDLTTRHVAPGERVEYEQAPPVGGDHAPQWIECGVYDTQLPEENVVHDLEHGTVWITYDPERVGRGDVDTLAAALPDDGIISAYRQQETRFVVTVWGRQLGFDRTDDPRLALFIATFGNGETAPEPAASCHGGVDPDDVAGGAGVSV